MIVYLAHPIDSAEDADLQLGEVAEWLLTAGHVVFDPGAAWAVPGGAVPEPGLQAINMAALRGAHAVVALMPEGVPTIGTVIEVVEALNTGQKCLIVTDHAHSWALAWLSHNYDGNARTVNRAELEEGIVWLSR